MKLEHLFPKCSTISCETTSSGDRGSSDDKVSSKTLPRRHQYHSTLSRRFLDGVKTALEKLSIDMQNNDYSVVKQTNEITEEKIFVYREISSLVGIFRFRLIRLLGFARLSPGDLFEIILKHGQQHSKAKCRIQGFEKDQLWDQQTFFFEYEFGEAFSISAFEWNSISKSCLIDNETIDLLTFLTLSEEVATLNLTRTGSVKVDAGIEWRPLDNCDPCFSVTSNSILVSRNCGEKVKNKQRPISSIRQRLLNRRLTIDDNMLIFALTDTFRKISHQLDRYRYCNDSQLGDLEKVAKSMSFSFLKPSPSNDTSSYSSVAKEWIFDTSSYDLNICFLQHLRKCSTILHEIFTSIYGRQYKQLKLCQLDDEILILNDLFDLKTISSLSDLATHLTKLKVAKDLSNFWLSACGNKTEICMGLFLTYADIKQELERTFGYFVTTNFCQNSEKVFDDILKDMSEKRASEEDLIGMNTICTVFEFTLYFKDDSIMAVCERFSKETRIIVISPDSLLEKLSSDNITEVQNAFDIMNSKFFDPKIFTTTMCRSVVRLLTHPNNVLRTSSEAFVDAVKCSTYLVDLTEKITILCVNADDFRERLGACRALYCLNAHDRLSTLFKVFNEDENEIVRAEASKIIIFFQDQMAESQRRFFIRNSDTFNKNR
uniref:FAM65 N-terminal domain-containing protein n=1 Tax=Romanomermis culicivorax TaxID=13658 RepID=A0A915I967_ROMCU